MFCSRIRNRDHTLGTCFAVVCREPCREVKGVTIRVALFMSEKKGMAARQTPHMKPPIPWLSDLDTQPVIVIGSFADDPPAMHREDDTQQPARRSYARGSSTRDRD